ENPDAMRLALARHDALMRAAIESNGGVVFKTIGDAFCAAFSNPRAAVEAALDVQLALLGKDGVVERWSDGVMRAGRTQQSIHRRPPCGHPLHHSVPLRVRIAVHTGQAERR